jgi:hypothetical protein
VPLRLEEYFNQFLIPRVGKKNMNNPLERIRLCKFIDLHSKGIRCFQVKENGYKQVIIVCLGLEERFKKNDIKRKIK